MAAWRYDISLLVLAKYFTCSRPCTILYLSQFVWGGGGGGQLSKNDYKVG